MGSSKARRLWLMVVIINAGYLSILVNFGNEICIVMDCVLMIIGAMAYIFTGDDIV